MEAMGQKIKKLKEMKCTGRKRGRIHLFPRALIPFGHSWKQPANKKGGERRVGKREAVLLERE